MPLTPGPVNPVPCFWTFYGHSYYQGAFGVHNPQGRADSIMRNLFDLPAVQFSRNQAAVGARLVLSGAAQAGWTRVMQNERGISLAPSYPDTAGSGAFFLGWGINDIGFAGNTAQMNAAYQHALRACISRCRVGTRVWEASNAAFTYGAGFTVQNFQWDVGSGDSYYSATTTTTATISWTIPADYKGGPLVFLFLAQPGVKGATFTWGGTAGVTGTTSTSNIVPAALATTRVPVVRRITNLTSANAGQTITLTATAIDATGSADFCGCWIESPWPPPVLVANAPRLNALGYSTYQGTYTTSLNATAVASTPGTITLASGTTLGLSTAGSATIPSAGGTVTISWTGTTLTTLTGVTHTGGSGNYSSNTLTWPGPVDADILAFNAAVLPSLLAEFDGMVQLVDLDSAIAKDPVALGSDGLHPSELGAARIADAWFSASRTLAPSAGYGEAAQMNVPNQALVPLITPHLAASWYDSPALGGPNGTAYAAVAGDLWALPFTCTRQGENWLQWSVETLAGSAAATIQFAVFDDRQQSGLPKYAYDQVTSSPITLATGAAVFTSVSSAGNGFLNLQPDPGLYWLVLLIVTAGTGVTFRTMKGPSLLMPSPQGGTGGYCGWKLTGKGSIPTIWDFPNTPGLNNPFDNVPRIQIRML